MTGAAFLQPLSTSAQSLRKSRRCCSTFTPEYRSVASLATRRVSLRVGSVGIRAQAESSGEQQQQTTSSSSSKAEDDGATAVRDRTDVGSRQTEKSHDVDHKSTSHGDGVGSGDDDEGSGNGGGGNGKGKGGGGEGDEKGAEDAVEAAHETKEKLTDRLYNMQRKLLVDLKAIIHYVPAQVIVAIISVLSTVVGQRYKRRLDQEKERKERIEEEEKRREHLEDELHALFQDFTGPLLRSSSKLADRLYTLVSSPGEAFEHDADPLYTAYVIGRYFAVIEMLKLESPNLDFGFPAADRIFLNIIGRIQGVLAANDPTLRRLQKTERSFKAEKDETILKGGMLQISPYAQSVCGDLMLRVRWNGISTPKETTIAASLKKNRKNHDNDDNAEGDAHRSHRGIKAVLTFLEFSELMQHSNAMSKWYTPIIRDIERLNINRSENKGKSMKDIAGARIYVLQSALCDLVEFLDPSPRCRFIPRYRRNRLQLSQLGSIEVQPTPDSLLTIYRQMTHIRDQEVDKGKYAKYKIPLEVYVKGPYSRERDFFDSGENGDCPYSQRVLITLEEMHVKYKKVSIYPERKPTWFPLLNAEGQVPVIVHEGQLIEDSRQIISYLSSKFPHKTKHMASTKKLHLTSGTAEFTKFYPAFTAYLQGKGSAKNVESELQKLNTVLARVHSKQEGGLFGGKGFSRIDTAVAPFLHHVAVAGPILKGMKPIESEYPALKSYLEACFNAPSFEKTKSTNESIVKGYSRLQMAPERPVRLPDLLE